MTTEQLIFWAAVSSDKARQLCAGLWRDLPDGTPDNGTLDVERCHALSEQARKLSCAATELLNRAKGNKPAKTGD